MNDPEPENLGELCSPQRLLDEARNELSHADQKAALLLASLGVGAGAALGGFVSNSWSPSELTGVSELTWWAAVISYLVSVACCGLAVWPRFKVVKPNDDVPVKYWADVAAFPDMRTFTEHWKNNRQLVYDRDLNQLFQISTVLSEKYRLSQWAYSASAVSGILFIITGVLI